ncbi:MAG: ABC transporter permease [Cyanobacteria bacterium]|nr:ABC transporter permease [Cyanobacteriota bacterium]
MIKRILKIREFYIFLIILTISAIMSFLNPTFLTVTNILDVIRSYSFMGILAVGSFVVMISGGIDVSFTAVASIASYVMGIILSRLTGNLFLAFFIVAAVGIILGSINALLIYFLKIPTIVVTISTLNLYYGLLIFFSKGLWIQLLPNYIKRLGNMYIFTLVNNKSGALSGLSIFTIIWIIVIFLTWALLKYTVIGRSIYAMGGNSEAARREGLNIFRLQLFIYTYMGFLSGIAGLVHVGLNQTIAPNAIVGTELTVIAAVVIGGTSLAGGSGTLLGTTLGVALLAVISNGLTLARITSFWQNVIIGFILIVSVSITAYQNTFAKKKISRVKVD